MSDTPTSGAHAHRHRHRDRPVFPSAAWVGGPLAIGLLVAVIASDPGRIDRRSGAARGLSVTLTLVLVFVAGAAAVALVVETLAEAPS